MPHKKIARKRSKARKQQTSKTVFWLRPTNMIKPIWKRSFWNKIWLVLAALLLVSVSSSYGVAQWYIQKHSNEPLVWGATFVPNYSRYFGIDPKETLQASIDDLGITRWRLVSYWSDMEATQGTYNFDELDWQFDMVERAGGTVSLAIGLRQPRWPECHMPTWAKDTTRDQWYPQLKNFMQAVIERYKDRPSLISYQLENEFLLDVFGECPDHDVERLRDEFKFVKSLDSSIPLIVSRSNNAIPSWPINEPRADLIGATVYKRVWDKTITKRYFEYPLPAWFYAFLAGGAELTTGVNTFIHELQAEPWVAEGFDLVTSPQEEQYKSMNVAGLRERFNYARATGIKTIDLWGIEWWYWQKVARDNPTIWETAKQELQKDQR